MTKNVDVSYRFCLMGEPKATLTDTMGNFWCEEHKVRHDLMNWGHVHGWPLVNCQAPEETVNIRKGYNRFYAIGPGYDLWKMACILGTDHFMLALSTTVLEASTQE